MIVDVLQTASFTEIERVRKLLFPGQVLVEEGMEVHPSDVVAEAQVPSAIMMLDIANGLALSPEETTACMLREVDDILEEGDVIAQCEKKLPRLFRAPADGKIISYHQGGMVLATETSKITITANMIGIVKEIIPEYGVVLSSHGSVIQGYWGNGLSGSGVLKVLEASLDRPITVSMLGDMAQDQVIASCACLDEDALDACFENQISGLILSALSTDLIEKVNALPFPVIVLHGFGEHSLAQDVFEIFQSHSEASISLNACPVDYFDGERPEVIIPKDEGQIARSLGFRKTLEVGDRVRITSGKMFNQLGKVVELLEEGQVFENGVVMPAAIVKLQRLEKVKVSQHNLVVVG
ncbi:MAG: hypothetical protein SVP52_07785 [Chloroflexota bacterium]|nr:hypothetical protein [Chloroflexota bacterium]